MTTALFLSGFVRKGIRNFTTTVFQCSRIRVRVVPYRSTTTPVEVCLGINTFSCPYPDSIARLDCELWKGEAKAYVIFWCPVAHILAFAGIVTKETYSKSCLKLWLGYRYHILTCVLDLGSRIAAHLRPLLLNRQRLSLSFFTKWFFAESGISSEI